jgi:hypothetical protein
MVMVVLVGMAGLGLATCSRPGDIGTCKVALDKQRYEEGFKCLEPLARKGNAVAQSTLGFMYMKAIGVPRDDRKALAWSRKAAVQGDASAQTNIGVMYLNGWGVLRDDHQASHWFHKAARQGYADAQQALEKLGSRKHLVQ